MIVADTNLLAYLLVSGSSTAAAERVRAKDKIWIAPTLLKYKLLSVLPDMLPSGRSIEPSSAEHEARQRHGRTQRLEP